MEISQGEQPIAPALETDFFSRRSLIVVSNRGPITFQSIAEDDLQFQRGSGGLVTALLGLLQKVDATWIACARTEADSAWKDGDFTLQEKGARIHLTFLSPDSEAYEGYYNVIANPLLWFLQHSMWNVSQFPVIDRGTWRAWENGYKRINKLFADAVIRQVRKSRKPPLVMLQDYHLYLAARYVRERMPPKKRPTLMHFTHIPWPGPEYWRILPPAMRQTILDGMCAADILGFQTRDDGLNFVRTCESFLPRAHVNFRHGWIWYRNHTTHVRDFPISIDVSSLKELSVAEATREFGEEIDQIVGDRRLIVRVDRIEPSKNIIRGFQAYEELLEIHPEHQGKVVFLAVLVPSRAEVSEYQDYQDQMMAAAGRVNTKFGTSEWEPVRLLIGEDYPRAIAALQRYDALLVNTIADGMNLVAKEGPIVNWKNGVLVLSESAGASEQLGVGAIVISPCDVYATAEALHQALTMPEAERAGLANRLRWVIEKDDIVAWLVHQLEAVVELNL